MSTSNNKSSNKISWLKGVLRGVDVNNTIKNATNDSKGRNLSNNGIIFFGVSKSPEICWLNLRETFAINLITGETKTTTTNPVEKRIYATK